MKQLLPSLREVFDADGVLASIAGDSFHDGLMLREPAAARCASGVLHVPFGQDSYLTFLRREEAESVAWAGRGPDDVEADAAARVVSSLSAPYRLDDHEIEIGASVGAAGVASAGDTVAAVMARADEALYVAKRAGRGRYALADGNAEGATRAE